MLALLSPRLWIFAAIVAALAFSHFSAYRKGKANVRMEWQAATAAANLEVRKIEQHRETVLGVARKSAAARAVVNRVDASRAAGALVGVRDIIAARRMAEESAAACTVRAATLEQLLLDSGDVIQEMARAADGHVNDVRLLIEAWPR